VQGRGSTEALPLPYMLHPMQREIGKSGRRQLLAWPGWRAGCVGMRPTAARPVRRRERRWRRAEWYGVDDLRLSGGWRLGDRTDCKIALIPAEHAQRLRPNRRSRDSSRHGIGGPSRRQHGDKAVDRFNQRGAVGRPQRIIAAGDRDAIGHRRLRDVPRIDRPRCLGRLCAAVPKERFDLVEMAFGDRPSAAAPFPDLHRRYIQRLAQHQ